MSNGDHIEIVPLGGLGEFGMNTLAVRYGGAIVVIDAGLMFPRDDLLGVDIVVPDLSYLKEHAGEVRAVILTHGHEDHMGGLAFLLDEINAPVYGTPLTLGLARGRLQEHRILDQADLRPISPRERLYLEKFEIDFIGMTHSLANSVGLSINTPLGRIIHTGDFKFDHSPPDRHLSDYSLLTQFGDEGVLALLSDSTNSERTGYTPSEMQVAQTLEQIFRVSTGKIIVACFASSIHRIQIVINLAALVGRKVVPLGRSMVQNIAIARELGYLSDSAGVLTTIHEGARLPSERVLLLSSGSQGEPMAALARLALEKHKHFQVDPGDKVIISARTIPGNESRISHLINHFCRRGATVIDERSMLVHASGHASQEELKWMLNLTRPTYFMPIHGEYRQLHRHALLAQEAGIPRERILIAETGDVVAVAPGIFELRGRVPVGRRLIDEGGITELDECVVRDRQQLSEEGVVLAVVAVDRATGEIEGAPEIVSRGHSQELAQTSLMAEAREVVRHMLQECSAEERSDQLLLAEMVRTELKRFFRKRTASRPMIVPVVLEI
ncbi:MAG: ribonuclease J [Acidobacteriota bacterium]